VVFVIQFLTVNRALFLCWSRILVYFKCLEIYYVYTTKPNRLILLGIPSLFIVRTIRNTQILVHCVGRMYSFGVLKRVVHIVTTGL
jgi:hypothetical protein